MKFDIIIVGAGLVGATMANCLADTPFKVALVDGSECNVNWKKDSYDLRVSAITQASQRIFENLLLWDELKKLRVSPFRDMHVWDAAGNGQIHFDSAELGESHLGHIIENNAMLQVLFNRLNQADNVTVMRPIKLTSFIDDGESIQITTACGQALHGQLAIGADGANSWLRQQTGISIKSHDYGHHGLVTSVATEKTHRCTAWQRFLSTGPLALLPLREANHCSIVWSTNPEHAQQLVELPEEQFNQQLTQAFDNQLGKLVVKQARVHFPLRMRHAKCYVKSRVALIGDAAHTIHPLAGQGVNLGLLDAASLTDVLLNAQQKGRDIANLATLRRYERWRKGPNLAMITAMDGFKQLFASQSTLVTFTRSQGLNLTNQMTWLKSLIMKNAMGLCGDLPPLAKFNVTN